MKPILRSAWDVPAFRWFYAGQAFSAVGDGLRTIAIPLLIFQISKSAAAVGLTFALEYLPLAVLSVIGGSLADRLDRRRTFIVCDMVRLIVVSLVAIQFARFTLSLGMVYFAVLVVSAASAIFSGSRQPALIFMLGKDRMPGANAKLSAAEQAISFIAPPLGAYLYAVVGPVACLAIDAVSYLISQFSVIASGPLGPETVERLPGVAKIRADFALAFRALSTDAALFRITLLDGVQNLLLMMTGAVLVPYLRLDILANNQTIGVIFGLGSLGAFAGSLLAGRMPNPFPIGALTLALVSLNRLILVPLLFSHSVLVVAIVITFWNAITAFEALQLVAWRLRIIPTLILGRVFGAITLIRLGGVVPGAILGGIIADAYGARTTVAISIGLSFVVLTFALAQASVRMEAR